MVKKNKNYNSYTTWNLLKDYWIFLEGRRIKFTILTLLKSLADLFGFLVLYLAGGVVDFFTTYSKGASLERFYLLVFGVMFFSGLAVWLRFFAKLRLGIIGSELRSELRLRSMKKMMNFELSWHENENTGSKIQKINSGGESVYRMMWFFSNYGISIPTKLIAGILIFMNLGLEYLLFVLIYLGVYFYGENYFNKKIIYLQDKLSKMGEKVSGKIHESASNLLTVKSLGLKGNIGKRTGYYEQKYHKTFLAAKMAGVAKSRTIKIFSAICNGLFLLMLGYATIRGDITVGMILVYYGYFGRVIGSAHEVTNSIGQYLHIKSLIGRFMTILGKNSIERDSPSLLKFPKNWKTIKFVNVDFKYKSKKVLNNFNLIIRRGDQIGFVGRSGCGKSTLVKLLMGLYHPSKGEILIDDVNLNKFRHSSITDNLGIVLQDSEMFNMSLKENICISSSKENPKLLRKALDVSNLRPVIKKLPNKLNTLVGEKGYKLSGGERQRVGIARAIYKNSSLMMLDETTSSLDSKTERIIQNNIEKKLKNKTLLTIAHRLSTLRNTERIIFMENGKISEEGSFKELVKMKKKFYKLYKLQKH